jgi:hypothetical protein
MVGSLSLLGRLYRHTGQGDLRAIGVADTTGPFPVIPTFLRCRPARRQLERGRLGTGRLFVRSVAVPDPGDLPG